MNTKTKMTRMALQALFGASLLLGVNPAFAEGEAKTEVSAEGVVDASVGATTALPEGADLASLEVVKVQPVMFQSTDTMAAVDAVMTSASMASAEEGQAARIMGTMPPVEMGEMSEEGFDFGGESTQLDIISMQYAYILGSLPVLFALDKDGFKKTVDGLAQFAPLHGAFSAKTKASLDAYAAALKAGKLDSKQYIQIMLNATQGIASAGSPAEERRHGYLLLGMWAGYVTMSAETGKLDKDLAGMGNGLVMMLEKDAVIGGSDKQLAAKVKQVNAAISGGTPDKAKIAAAVKAMLAVTADK